MSQEWYYSVDGSQQGPVSPGELKKLTDASKISQADLVWKEGMAEWVPAKTIKGLFATGSATPTGGTAAKTGEQAAAKAEPVEERPSSRGRPRDEEEEEERPRRRRDADEANEEDRPLSRRRDEDEEEERPVRRRRDEDDDMDERPRKRRKGGRVPEDTANKKMVAGLLGILLGGWGIHKFYLGMTTPGILQIVISICTCGLGGIIGLIEGIIYLTKSDEDFHQMYVVEQKGWF